MKSAKKILKVLLLTVLVLSMVLDVPFRVLGPGANAQAAVITEPGFILNDVRMKFKGGAEIPLDKSIEIDESTVIELSLNWKLDNSVEITTGDTASIQIPDIFVQIDPGAVIGNMIMKNGEGEDIIVGTYSLDTSNLLLLTFNHELGIGGTFEEDREGEVKIEFKIDVTKFTEDSSQEITFGGTSLTIPITVKKPALPGAKITKEETHAAQNPKYIDWIIEVNTELATINDAVVSDTIPAGLALLPDSLTVEKLKIGYSGTKTVESDVTGIVKSATGSAISATGFQLGLGEIRDAYRITYRTNITEYGRASYKNNAILKDGAVTLGTASKTITNLVMGSYIEKSGLAQKYDGVNSNKITWTIDVNKAEEKLENVMIEDPPAAHENQTVDNSTVEVWKLKKSGGSWVKDVEVTDTIKDKNILDGSGNLQFPLTLGELDKEAYRIIFNTDIIYPTDYVPELKLSNEATLTYDGGVPMSVSGSVTVARGPLLTKLANSTINYGTKEILWTLELNQGNHTITNAVLYDNLPAGLTLDPDTIIIKDETGATIYSPSDAVNHFPSGLPAIQPSGTITGGTEFTVELGDISKKLTVTYVTKILPSAYGQKFKNEAWLTGGGIGPGSGTGSGYPGTKYPVGKEIQPGIGNYFDKGTITGKVTVGGVEYDGLNYANKTMSWQLKIEPVKEGITELEISDTFPNNGLFFLKDTLRFVKKDSAGNITVIPETDYTITDQAGTDSAYQNGFKLKLKPGVTLKDSDYFIYYKTSFDRDEVGGYPTILPNTSAANGSGNFIYYNKASFTYIPEGGVDRTAQVEDTANYTMNPRMHNNGSKESSSYNLQDRWIDWRIHANDQARTVSGGVLVVEDKFTAGQSLVLASIKVTRYSVSANGTRVYEAAPLVKGVDYTVDEHSDELGFTLRITTDPNKPYRIEYRTLIEGLSKNKYTNKATMEGVDYEATVTNPKYDQFLNKKTADDLTQVFRDDEIGWEAVLNESLSEVVNATFVDNISGAHEYVTGSLKVYRIDRNNSNAKTLVGEGDGVYILDPVPTKDNSTGVWTLTVKFPGTIHHQYQIEYLTAVTGTSGQSIRNGAKFTGDGVKEEDTNSNETITYTISQTSSATGTGKSSKGDLKIRKVDMATLQLIQNAPATFELYYKLNGVDVVVGGSSEQTGNNGELTYQYLPTNREYYLRETAAPNGFIYDNTDPLITIPKGTLTKNGTHTVSVPNEKKEKSLKITKVDIDNPGAKLQGAKFELYRVSAEPPVRVKVGGTYQTDSSGEVTIDGLVNGTYELVETAAPGDYQLPVNNKTVIVISKEEDYKDAHDNMISQVVGNEHLKSIALTKVDVDNAGLGLPDAEFKLFRTDVNPEVQIGTIYKTIANGKLVISGLVNGTYRLEETKAPAGYQLPANPKLEITVNGITDTGSDGIKNNIVICEIKNEQLKSIVVTKVDTKEPGKGLEGAEFRLFRTDVLPEVQIGTVHSTLADGTLVISGLENGSYRLEEIKAPAGYQLPEHPNTFIAVDAANDVSSDGTKDYKITGTITNDPLKSVIVKKVDSEDTSKVLEGAEFELYDSDHKLIKTYTTGKDGTFKIENLKVGRYRLVETKAPGGYHLPDPDKRITVIDIAYNTDYDYILPGIENQILREIKIKKVDSNDTNVSLNGAEFELWKDGTKVSDHKIVKDGELVISGLLLGDYTLVETKAPEGYQLPKESELRKTRIEIKTGAALTIEQTIRNDKMRSLILKKVNSNNPSIVLSGAEFKVKAPDGTEQIVTTGHDGTVTLDGLVYGDYVITELKAPIGYNLDNTPVTVTLDTSELTFTKVIQNTEYKPWVPGNPQPTVTPTPSVTPTPTATPGPTVTPGPTITPKPTPGLTPKPEPTGKPTPSPSPTPVPITEITPENTPKGGTVPVPEGGTTTKGKEPENGKVKVDKEGNWTYKPDPGFTGKDDFSVIVTGPDGEEEEVFVEIDVEEVPLSGDNSGKGKGTGLPGTGEWLHWSYFLIGILACLAGIIVIAFRNRKKPS